MSVGWHAIGHSDAPRRTLGGPDLRAAVAAARKTKVGIDSDLRPVWRLDADVQYHYWRNGPWGPEPAARAMPAGTIVADDGGAPGIWASLSDSVEHGDEDLARRRLADEKAERERASQTAVRRIAAAFAARWVAEHIPPPPGMDAEGWYDAVSLAAAGETKGMHGGKTGIRTLAYDALRQYEQGETDAARDERIADEKAARERAEIEAHRAQHGPFAALATLRMAT